MSLFPTFSKLGIPSHHAIFHIFLLERLLIFFYTFYSETSVFWHAVRLLIPFIFVTVLNSIITGLEVKILFVKLIGSDHLDTVLDSYIRARIIFTYAFLDLSQFCNDFLFDANYLLNRFRISLSFCRKKASITTLRLWLNFLYLLYRSLTTFNFLFHRVYAEIEEWYS